MVGVIHQRHVDAVGLEPGAVGLLAHGGKNLPALVGKRPGRMGPDSARCAGDDDGGLWGHFRRFLYKRPFLSHIQPKLTIRSRRAFGRSMTNVRNVRQDGFVSLPTSIRMTYKVLYDALYHFTDDDGWAMASHVALSAILAVFPF